MGKVNAPGRGVWTTKILTINHKQPTTKQKNRAVCASNLLVVGCWLYSVATMDYLSGLNDKQREAVEYTEGPLLIVAGAGAGKTRVITHRILHLIKKGIEPSSILAITFTNKAAKEMRDRVFSMLRADTGLNRPVTAFPENNSYQRSRQGAGVPCISTFHSLGVQIIRENSTRLGISQNFTIYDKGDSVGAIKEALRRSDRDPKDFEPAKILSVISKEKGKMVKIDDFKERGAKDYFLAIVARVWGEYEKILKEEKALDFDDLLLKTASLLQNDAQIREHYQKKWRYIHIDEYQDTNHVQYMTAKLLADTHNNIAVVGDADQNIYSWRGASIKNILGFEKDYPKTKIVLLEQNYRSTQTILTVANHIIKKNKMRPDKNLFTENAEGEKMGLYTGYDEADEANFIAQKSKSLIEQGTQPKDIAVLFRANFQSRALEEAFLNADTPYQVLGTRFFERKEVKDVISYVRASLNPESLADLRRIMNVPPRGIGKVTLLKIFAGQEEALPRAMQEKIASFRNLLGALKAKLDTEPLSLTLKWIVTTSGIEADLRRGGTDEEERLENIKELVTFATRYDADEDRPSALNRFLTDVALQSDQDELKDDKNAVRLMTVHASKGLEFPYVFITGLEEGLFPHQRIGSHSLDENAKEEERRLFYVALTRAEKKVFLSYAGVRTVFGSRQVTVPSEFIFDIDEAHLEAEEKIEHAGKAIYFE